MAHPDQIYLCAWSRVPRCCPARLVQISQITEDKNIQAIKVAFTTPPPSRSEDGWVRHVC